MLQASMSSSSSSSRGAISLFPTSSVHDHTLLAKSGLSSFPHEEMNSIRAYSPSSNTINLVSEVTSVSSSFTSEAPGFRSASLPHWSASPLTPRYLTATTHHHHQLPPSPHGVLVTRLVTGLGRPSTEAVGNEVEEQSYSNGYSDATSATSMIPETTWRMEMGLTGTCSRFGGQINAVTAESTGVNCGGTAMTVSTSMTTLPFSMTRPFMIPPPPSPSPAVPVVIAKSSAAAPTRKRKRLPGALRMRNFLCMHPGCGKSFMDSAHLRDHTVVHTGEKKLSCSICQKLFARASTLQEHNRVHTGEKPYVCGVPGCSKRYSSRAAMRFHRTTHAPQLSSTASLDSSIHAENAADAAQVQILQTSPYVCSKCGKHFRVQRLLMAHLKTHTTHRAAALTSLASSGSATTAINEVERVEEDVSTVRRQMENEESSHAVSMRQSDESIHFQDTIRAQRDQIKQLRAEILRLRGQTSIDPAATPAQTESAVSHQLALTAPVKMLQDGFKPFECCICSNRFANFYQLTFHGKQHPEVPMAEVTGGADSTSCRTQTLP
ncbi:unnamed protein product [Peronospora belbahrii]|uniref:C2H2-type domain-containing protein n=1 Tax=Peronospora belbahrii TaxID=622444 RepID=A0AAU9LCC6_9STRA|nr:unnamed protein product [Peronospora belbahrii]